MCRNINNVRKVFVSASTYFSYEVFLNTGLQVLVCNENVLTFETSVGDVRTNVSAKR